MGAIQGLFHSSLAHIILVVSEKKIEMYKFRDRKQTPDDRLQVMAKAHPHNKSGELITYNWKIAIYLIQSD